MRFFAIIIMFSVILGANFYVFYRLWHIIPSFNIVRIPIISMGIIMILSLFVSIIAGGVLPSSLVAIMYKVSTAWFFISLYLLIIFLLLDLIRITHLFPIENFMYNSWLGFGLLTGLIVVIMTIGYSIYTHKKRVELTITIDNKEKMDNPLKILAISDLHLGYGIQKKEFKKWVQLINNENPDIVIIAGDIIDNNIRPLHEQEIAEVFKDIKTKHGVYAALGNHEYISGVSNSLHFLNDAGIHVLRDSATLINNSFYIVGRDDKTNVKRKSIEELMVSLDKSKPIIMLDHQPYNLENVEKNNIDFQLSGHTHKGQVIPISWITNFMYEKSYGYLKKGNSHIYVSSGLGIWGGKFRIGTRSEYVVINLETKN